MTTDTIAQQQKDNDNNNHTSHSGNNNDDKKEEDGSECCGQDHSVSWSRMGTSRKPTLRDEFYDDKYYPFRVELKKRVAGMSIICGMLIMALLWVHVGYSDVERCMNSLSECTRTIERMQNETAVCEARVLRLRSGYDRIMEVVETTTRALVPLIVLFLISVGIVTFHEIFRIERRRNVLH
jgi:hypothetical protein